MHKAADDLVALVRGVVEPMGYELVGVEHLTGSKGGGLLRVYIDRASGIGLQDCEAVSHQLSGVLDVEDPIRGEYTLEVSSPGLDRPLFERAHFERFVGREARVRMAQGQGPEGRRNFKGVIAAVRDDEVILLVDGEEYRLPLAEMDSARLVPEL